MPAHPVTQAQKEEARDTVLSEGSVSAAARKLGIHRSTLQHRLREAEKAGVINRERKANPSRWRPGDEIVAARKAEFARVRDSAPNRDDNVIHLADDGPFMLIALGDEHLDSPGTDLDLFEYWISYLDREKRRTGISMGDVLDSWVKPLAFLYQYSETTAPEGWILLEHYMETMGPHLDLSVGGNHDAWSGSNDVLGMVMEKWGVLHRTHSIRAVYRCPNGREISVNARHNWPGRSMWNSVHGLKRAARMGVRDNILLGGHTHVSGEGMEKCPMSGKLSFCYQVASFKTVDDYADQLGFLDGHVSPAVALVIDPRRYDDDPELVKHFHDPEAAAGFLDFLRSRA